MHIRIYLLIAACCISGMALPSHADQDGRSGRVVSTDVVDSKASIDTQDDSISGITDSEIILGSVLPLDGRAAKSGIAIQTGLDMALAGKIVGERKVRIVYKNDLYDPTLTYLKVRRLFKQGIFAMVGNVGTPTAAAALPLLKHHGIPAIGFITGANLLRTGDGPILNYRASYAQETAAVIEAAILAGVRPEQVCAYVQNDAFGRSGLVGIQEALQQAHAPHAVLDGLDALLANANSDWILAQTNDVVPINNNGPVGVYVRNLREVKPGYESLKNWERKTGYHCSLVITIGTYDNLAFFIHTARGLGEKWIISAVSFTGVDNLRQSLQMQNVGNTLPIRNIIMSQVTPLLESNLPILQEAKNVLGKNLNFTSLEAYIVGKMTLELLRNTPTPLTREAFMDRSRQSHFDLGGIPIDFTHNGYQASNLVTLTMLTNSGYRAINTQDWRDMLDWANSHDSHNNQPANADTAENRLPTVSKKRRTGKK